MDFLSRYTFLEVSLKMWGKRSFEEAGEVYLRIQPDQMLSGIICKEKNITCETIIVCSSCFLVHFHSSLLLKRKFHLSLSNLSKGKSQQNETQAINTIQFPTSFTKMTPKIQAPTPQTACSLFSAYLWSSSGSNTVSTVHAIEC